MFSFLATTTIQEIDCFNPANCHTGCNPIEDTPKFEPRNLYRSPRMVSMEETEVFNSLTDGINELNNIYIKSKIFCGEDNTSSFFLFKKVSTF